MTTTYYVYSPLNRFLLEELKWCGCGSPELAMAFMRDVLSAIKTRSDARHDEASNAALKALLPYDSGLAESYWYMLDEHDLIEHGGTCAGGWLTEKGERVLALLNEFEDLEEALEDVEASEEEFERRSQSTSGEDHG
jgi:hypothetical protein